MLFLNMCICLYSCSQHEAGGPSADGDARARDALPRRGRPRGAQGHRGPQRAERYSLNTQPRALNLKS